METSLKIKTIDVNLLLSQQLMLQMLVVENPMIELHILVKLKLTTIIIKQIAMLLIIKLALFVEIIKELYKT